TNLAWCSSSRGGGKRLVPGDLSVPGQRRSRCSSVLTVLSHGGSGGLGPRGGRGPLGSDVVLARTSSRPLARNDYAGDEQLAAPDSPWLTPGERAIEALPPDRAAEADRLGELHVSRGFGEEELWIE